MSEFLERARDVEDEWFVLFAGKCWPEIIAVVEAADKWNIHPELRKALDALDKKAGEG